jgi:hypothetical protein
MGRFQAKTLLCYGEYSTTCGIVDSPAPADLKSESLFVLGFKFGLNGFQDDANYMQIIRDNRVERTMQIPIKNLDVLNIDGWGIVKLRGKEIYLGITMNANFDTNIRLEGSLLKGGHRG